MNNFYPATPKLPTAVMAWAIASWGAQALIVASPALIRPVTHRRWLVGAGVVLAAVTAATTTASALLAGNDSRFVDVRTASPAPIAPVSSHLGARAFTIRISGWATSAETSPTWRVEGAGAGFVTLGDGTVTGYGSDGKERWHYRRTGPAGLRPESLRVFDDGRTVVVGLERDRPRMLVGLDAVTGRLLWWSSDHPMIIAFDQPVSTWTKYLVGVSEDFTQWTRYDTRTGQRLWTTPAPSTECHGFYGGLPTLPAASYRCAGDPRPQVRFVDVDPATGEKRWQTTLLQDIEVPSSPELTIRPRTDIAGRNGALVRTQVRPLGIHGDRNISTFVNLTTHSSRNLGDLADSVMLVRQTRHDEMTSDDFLVDGPGGVELYGPDGRARCKFASKPEYGSLSSLDDEDFALVLGDEIVFGAIEKQGADYVDVFQTFSRSDCKPIATTTPATTSPTSSTYAFVNAPGVVLVVRGDKTGTYVDGYRD